MGLRQVSRSNPSTITKIWTPKSRIQHPKPDVKVLVHFRGFCWRSLYAFQTISANITTFGHCSRQVEGDRKLMGQLLVHPQRLGSLVKASSCTLVKDEQWLVAHSQSSTSCWGSLDWACLCGLVPLG